MKFFSAFPVLLPILSGGCLLRLRPENRRFREWYVFLTVLFDSALVFAAIALSRLRGADEMLCTLVRFESGMSISFRIDAAGEVFSALVATLWPLTTLYAFSYMRHEGKENKFFSFFLMSYGVVIGIAFAEDFLTLYIFYELLTLATLPLVMHASTKEARFAGRKYLIYSFSGAAAVFVLIIFFLQYGNTLSFTPGGILNAFKSEGNETILRTIFLVGFFGFGVKAAVFPLHGWLPDAAVAPTPVTALLHAVAVVKSGAFAIMRLIYYGFGTEFLRGTWAQYVCLSAAVLTIVFGSAKAVRSPHLKRRLAYSTVSNLSYIVFAFVLMTGDGLTAGLTHMVYHAFIKITLFFCAGIVLVQTEREYIYQLEGLGQKMKSTFLCFTVSALALMGIPPLGGFVGKWAIATAAVAEGSVWALIGTAALIVSAVLTVLYLVPMCISALFPQRGFDVSELAAVNEDVPLMVLPVTVLTVLGVVLALLSVPLTQFLSRAAAAL